MSFIEKLAEAVEKEYPKERADTSWDNTGILLEFDGIKESVLLCIDLTEEVLKEAISKEIETILAYHPPIFTPIKKITKNDIILYSCINNRISIYSPHTALDGGKNGINHWLSTLIPKTEYLKSYGFIQVYKNELSIKEVLESIDSELSLETIRYSLGTGHSLEYIPEVLAIGAGASSRNLKKLVAVENPNPEEPERLPSLVITGEASHHDLLYFKKAGVSVLLLEHSRSERGFLQAVKSFLKDSLPGAAVEISSEDRDPVIFYRK